MSVASEPSYSKIHYLLRPAKNIQRKMIAEALHRLDRVYPVKNYRYVGFGSIYFGDFSLFHRALGITDMISIEGNEPDEPRVRFNAPFSCIDIRMGLSNKRLPEIPLSEKRWVTWLDYDFAIDYTVLKDVRFAASQSVPGSVLLITLDVGFKGLNAFPWWAPSEHEREFSEKSPAQKVAYNLQRDVPEEVDLRGEGFSTFSRQLIAAEIGSGLTLNYENPNLKHHQILNFRYADGREMLTVAHLFLEEAGDATLNAFDFPSLRFYKAADEPFYIRAPKLTPMEIRRLNQELPDNERLEVPIPQEDRASYSDLYRYFPSFSEIEL